MLCDSLTLSHRIHLRQLLFVELIERSLDRADGVQQTAVVLKAGLGKDRGVLCADESFVSEGADVLAHCVDAHPCRRTNRFIAGPALVGTPVCAAEQISVHRELTRR